VCSDPGEACGFSCAANTYVRCAGAGAQVCTADGTDVSELSCGAAGCITDDNGPHCAHIVPEYAPTACDQPAALELYENAAASTLMTDSAACTYTITQADVSICVIRARTIALDALTVGGTAAVAFIADGELTVDGELIVAADGVRAGPGASPIPSGIPPDIDDGGGGAGYKELGGAGGDNVASFGTPIFPPRETTFLGGRSAGLGGGGGGGLMLISCHGTVTIRGVIDAGGGGGPGGHPTTFRAAAGGGGGGSGGHVLIQAVSVVLEAAGIYANGGGGGGGGDGVDVAGGGAGANGTRSTTTAAAGGPGTGTGAAPGGNGGTEASLATSGGASTVNTGDGGGGGSVGFIEIAMPANTSPMIMSTALSPAPDLLVVPTK
jgi:hypothetical protein